MIPAAPYGHLRPGRNYRVAREFTDYDGKVHPVGENWRFLGHNFLPYDDGLSLFVEIAGRSRQIRMQDRPEEQGGIIDDLQRYVVAQDHAAPIGPRPAP